MSLPPIETFDADTGAHIFRIPMTVFPNGFVAYAYLVFGHGGPTLIEAKTYRWRGHSKSDRNLYRTQQEIEEWKHKCPIRRFKKVLVDAAIMTNDEVEGIDQAAKTAVDRAAEEAQTFPEPSPENMEDEVYAP